MTLYIRKSLAHGPIRFGVSPRASVDEIDADASLSTGATGEFLRRRTKSFFLANAARGNLSAPTLPTEKSINATPFYKSVVDGTQRGWIFLGMMAFGLIFVLLGLAVLARKGPQGWVEIILGAAMIATPLVMTAQARKQIRDREEKERAEREEREKRHRAMLASYTAALENLKNYPNDATFDAVERERQQLDLPYDIWAPLARTTVLQIGFEALAKLTPARASEVADLMSRASEASGLAAGDELGVKLDLYRVVVWHLLADDRLGPAQKEQLRAFRKGFDIWDREVPVEAKAVEEFSKLAGVTVKQLPRGESALPLGFHEYCIHSSRGAILKSVREKVEGKRVHKLVPSEACSLYVTNKRVVVDAKKKVEIPLPKIDDVEVDIDQNVLMVRAARGIPPLELQVDDPIYTAALIDIATTIDERPRGYT